MALLLSLALLAGCAKLGEPELINVSYDPTREFYEEYNALFTEHWRRETGKHLEIIQSHGGSGAQALSVSQGLPADVVTHRRRLDRRIPQRFLPLYLYNCFSGAQRQSQEY